MINPWVAARTFLIVSESPKTFSYLKKGLLFYMNAKSIFCINTHYLYTNLRIHHGSIYAHYRKVGINYRSIGTSSCDWTKNVMSCVSCFYRKLKFLFDSRPFCNFDSAYSLFCRKKPVTILINNFHFSIYLGLDRHFIRINRCNCEIIWFWIFC